MLRKRGVARSAGCVLNCSHAARGTPERLDGPQAREHDRAQAREGKIMSNCLFANYLAASMGNLSPRGEELVEFCVSVVFADGHYTITARRDDCGGIHERHVGSYSRHGIIRAVLDVVREACGYRSSYWSGAKYCEVSRNIMAQLRPYLPER